MPLFAKSAGIGEVGGNIASLTNDKNPGDDADNDAKSIWSSDVLPEHGIHTSHNNNNSNRNSISTNVSTPNRERK
jgi:hypothetical protein